MHFLEYTKLNIMVTVVIPTLFLALMGMPLVFYIKNDLRRQQTDKKKEIKEIHIGKEVKLSLFADDMILYIENHKNTTKKLELKN